MPELAVTTALDAETHDDVVALLERVAATDGRFPLSDHLLLDLERGSAPGFVAVVAEQDERTVGYAQLSLGNGVRTLEVAVDPSHRDEGATLGRRLVQAALDAVEGSGEPVDWWLFDAGPADAALALDLGFAPTRHLHQMRRALPTGLPVEVTTRPFRVGADEEAWVSLNNRSFATHPEQGGWTVESLRRREAEPWFDPAGFLLHERDGRLAAFCWTKLHADAGGTNIGEIYVIGVDPDFQGLGLGRQLTLAGLDAIAARGVDVGMLYVDADNAAAVNLYEHLGFTIARTDRAYRYECRDVTESTRYGVDRDALAALLAAEPRYRIDQVWQGLYEHLAEPADMTNLPRTLRDRLASELPAALTLVTESVSDRGDTVKFLWELAGGARVETVLMLYPDRATVCVSSQAGCAMGCGFCATGQAGFARHLTTGEIVEQVVRAAQRARRGGRRVSNVVFMGMGEPLANEAAVWAAVQRFHGALGISARHLTVSTVGIVPGIRRLAERRLPVTLAVSLHAANDELRDELVPINRRYPIDALLTACVEFTSVNRRRLSFEWALIDGVNDRPSDAVELSALCRRLRPAAHVNLIPLNPTPGWPTRGTPAARVTAFRDHLAGLGVNATVRRNRGTDIDAACGQLAASAPVRVGSEGGA